MTLVAGSYEKYILGWRVCQKKKKKEGQDEDATLKPIFTYPAHMGPIKCMAMAGPVLVTGGMDDTIKIFDMTAYCEMGSLLQHKGAVTSLCFFGSDSSVISGATYPKNLISGSQDGTICIWDADLWVHFKTMKAHKKGVNDLAIHPSGRLVLSVGRDCHLSMFNLINGRCNFTSNLQKEATLIKFNSKGGDSYSMVTEDIVSIHNAEDARLLHSLGHSKRVLCLAPSENGLLLTGGEEPTIRAWDVASGKIAFSVESAHKSRIKGLAVLGSNNCFESDNSPHLVASASSDGLVRVWDVRMVTKENPVPVMESDSKARLTCLAGCSSKRVKKSPTVLTQGKLELNSQEKSLASSQIQNKNTELKDSSIVALANQFEPKGSPTVPISEKNKSTKRSRRPEKKSQGSLKMNKKFKYGLGVKGKKGMKLKGNGRSKEEKPET